MVNSNLAYKDIETEILHIKDEPIKWCSVSLSDVINSGKRIDAELYDVELQNAKNIILGNKRGIKYLTGYQNSLCESYRPGICKRNFVEYSKSAIPMLTPSQIININPKADKYLSQSFCNNAKDWFVKSGEILLTCSGTIGNVSLVTKTLKNKCISQNLIRIVPKDSNDTGYIYAYLKSKPCQLFLTRSNYGAVIKHIDPSHLDTVPIPNAPTVIKEKINNLILSSYQLRDESNELINTATQLLINELNLPDINEFEVDDYRKDAPVETYSVKLSELNGRVDASYHLPIVNAIIEHLQKYADEVTTVGNERISSDIILPGRFKRVYVEEGYGIPFFGGRSIGELDPSDKRFLSFSQHNEKIKKELIIKEGMILITCSGTIGNIALVPRHWDNWAMTHDIIRLVALDYMKGYVYIWLQSDYGKELIKSKSYGSVVSHIEKNHLAEIPIPIVKNLEIQKKINELALEANQKRYEAYKLEQQALDIMDNEVIFAK